MIESFILISSKALGHRRRASRPITLKSQNIHYRPTAYRPAYDVDLVVAETNVLLTLNYTHYIEALDTQLELPSQFLDEFSCVRCLVIITGFKVSPT